MKFSRSDSRVRMSRLSDVSGTNSVPSSGCAAGMVVPKRHVLVLPNHQHTLKMWIELVPETSVNHILKRLSARENVIFVNCSKTHVSGNWSVPISSVGVVTNVSAEMDASRGERGALGSLLF